MSSGRTSRYEFAINDYIDNIAYVDKHPYPGALLVIFLLETSKIILHCKQSGDDNIAEYGFDGDEMNIRRSGVVKEISGKPEGYFPIN